MAAFGRKLWTTLRWYCDGVSLLWVLLLDKTVTLQISIVTWHDLRQKVFSQHLLGKERIGLEKGPGYSKKGDSCETFTPSGSFKVIARIKYFKWLATFTTVWHSPSICIGCRQKMLVDDRCITKSVVSSTRVMAGWRPIRTPLNLFWTTASIFMLQINLLHIVSDLRRRSDPGELGRPRQHQQGRR